MRGSTMTSSEPNIKICLTTIPVSLYRPASHHGIEEYVAFQARSPGAFKCTTR